MILFWFWSGVWNDLVLVLEWSFIHLHAFSFQTDNQRHHHIYTSRDHSSYSIVTNRTRTCLWCNTASVSGFLSQLLHGASPEFTRWAHVSFITFISTLQMTCSDSKMLSVVCISAIELYESTEYSAVTINETWSQQLTRISQAIGFSAAQLGKQLFDAVGFLEEDEQTDTDTEKKNTKWSSPSSKLFPLQHTFTYYVFSSSTSLPLAFTPFVLFSSFSFLLNANGDKQRFWFSLWTFSNGLCIVPHQ